jgi:RimJ/RimL family protein N-acetyltransferase
MNELPRIGRLRGRHVELEALAPDHADQLAHAAAGDRSSYGFTRVPDGPTEARTYVSDLLALAERGEAAPFVQRRLPDSIVVGATRYMEPRWPLGRSLPDEVEIGGTWLSGSAQRTPINTEAKLLLLTQAFDGWGVQRVAICTDARNEASRRAIERLGAGFDGVLPRHRPSMIRGEETTLRDSALYSITVTSWPAVRDHLEALSTR